MALRPEDYVKGLMVQTAWRYASQYGGHTAMSMVMQVIKNRQSHGWGTFLQIIDRMPNFEAAPAPVTGSPDIWDRNFLKALTEVDSIFDGTAKDITNGALYFGDTTNIENAWFLSKICRSGEKQRCADMGSLVFWR